MSVSASSTEQMDAFTILMQKHDVIVPGVANDSSQRFMDAMKAEGVKSIEDFVGFVDSKDFENDWKEFCTNPEVKNDQGAVVTEAKLNRALWARVKSAWKAAYEARNRAGASAATEAAEDLDAPLPPSTVESLQGLWDKRYSITLKVNLKPADPLIGRIYRELRRKCPTVIAIRKVKALIHAAVPHQMRRLPMDNQVFMTLTMGEAEDLKISNVVGYYWGLRTLAYAYAFAGIEDAPSHLYPGAQVTNAPLDVNIDYADDALRAATNLDANPHAALAWLEDRDIKTRSSMVSLMRQGWPQGEALLESKKEHSLDWYTGPNQQRQAQPHPAPRPAPSSGDRPPKPGKRSRAEGKGRGKGEGKAGKFAKAQAESTRKQICIQHNRGNCTPKQKDCPRKMLHACNFVKPDGAQCGNPNHTAAHHK